jgi:hypothetical protein
MPEWRAAQFNASQRHRDSLSGIAAIIAHEPAAVSGRAQLFCWVRKSRRPSHCSCRRSRAVSTRAWPSPFRQVVMKRLRTAPSSRFAFACVLHAFMRRWRAVGLRKSRIANGSAKTGSTQ